MSARVAVIDTGICNLRSVTKALEAVGASPVVVRTPAEADACGADGMVLPGVGALRDCVLSLRTSGLDATVRRLDRARPPVPRRVPGHAGPVRLVRGGRCERARDLPGTGGALQAGTAAQGPPHGLEHRAVRPAGDTPLQAGLADDGESFYFVHSYHCVPEDRGLVLAECDYGPPFVAAIARGRLFATQFHPEKSQAKGLANLSQFRGVGSSRGNRLIRRGDFVAGSPNFSLQAAHF